MIEPTTKMEFVWVPSGTFTVGSGDSDPDAYGDEKPDHQVTISTGFYIGKYPVTVRQWDTFLTDTGRDPHPLRSDPRFNHPDQPVVLVNWDEATAFCRWLNKMNPGKRFSLPTEAEWEYAARGSDGRKYPWGNCPPTEAHAHFRSDRPAIVGPNKRAAGASPFGAYDMSWNVCEWGQDWYGPYHPSGGLEVDPTGPAAGPGQVVRGGCWFHVSAASIRGAHRYWYVPIIRSCGVGFRVACRPLRTP